VVLLLALALALAVGVIPVVIVVLFGGVELLGRSAMKWVVSPHSMQPMGDHLLSL
jgi:hypothetical protein